MLRRSLTVPRGSTPRVCAGIALGLVGLMSGAVCADPLSVTLDPPRRPLLTSGATFSCVLVADNPECWGTWGEPSRFHEPQPLTWSGGSRSLATVSSDEHSCMLTVDGQAFCWGPNDFGQLGDGTTDYRSDPVAVDATTAFSWVAPGSRTTCGIDALGVAYCWGRDALGALGRGSAGNGAARVSPARVEGEIRFGTLAGATFYCGLSVIDSLAHCWGSRGGSFDTDSWVESGDCATAFYLDYAGEDCWKPTPVRGSVPFESLTVGGTTACATSQRGMAFCWGDGPLGQLGNGASGPGTHSVEAVAVMGDFQFLKVSAGASHVCALEGTGRAYCWGNNLRGYLGVDPSQVALSAEPLEVYGDHRFVDIASGWYHTCALTESEEIWCWGSGASGALGRHPDRGDSHVPLRVSLSAQTPS